MTNIAIADLARVRVAWPEPVLIDLISETYGEPPGAEDRFLAARIHTRFLRDLIDGEIRAAAALRVELIACCAARGIAPGAIEAADQAAFLELMRMVRTRFRNSPRQCLLAMQQLHLALGRLPKKAEPDAKARTAAVLRRKAIVPKPASLAVAG